MLSRQSRFWGAVLLVAGTTIGAGMLALPVITGPAGFFPSLALMTVIFLFMLCTALYLLEVNLKMKSGVNLISMVHKTLHRPGEIVAWICYLLLLYSLTAAYLVGCSQILFDLLSPILKTAPPDWLGPLVIFLIFGSLLYFGTLVIDMLNRVLMAALFVSFLLLLSL